MAKGFKKGVGGVNPLNFKVVGNPQPTNPKENTIWLNTDTPITGWEFTNTEPSKESGKVWIKTGTFSTSGFNAIKKNRIQVHPIEAYQCDGSVWSEKPAKCFQDGAWKDWILYLYDLGDEKISVTGGWTYKNLMANSGANTNLPEITFRKNSNNIYFANAGFTGAVMYCIDMIDLSGRSTITFKATSVRGNSSDYPVLYVWTAFGSYQVSNVAASVQITGDGALDVSALSGKYIIGIGVYSSNCAVTLTSMYIS